MERLLKYSAVALIVAMVGTLSYGLGATRSLPSAPTAQVVSAAPAQSNFAILEEVFQTFRDHYVDPSAVEFEPLRTGAIRGMIEAIGDPNQAFIDAERYQLDRNDFQGSFEGIGATVTMQEGMITIIAPIRDSPAERAGIRPGDVILEIDGDDARGISLAEAVSRIRGPRGTPVTLTILHQGETEPVEITIVRDEIETESVFVREIEGEPDLAHLIISEFTDRTPEEMEEALGRLRDQGVRGIIVDVRNNPGGLLIETVEVTSHFLDDGVVLREIGRDGQEREFEVIPGGLATDIPIVVLVNQGSASGAEVLAGAVQDYDRAAIVGTETFGKGSVNRVHELSDGSALYVTIARWFTPLNRQIEGTGLQPDIVVELTEDDIENENDRQLDRAIEVLRSQL